jgi:hypothetical protein
MRRTKTLTSLVAAVVLALTLGGYAYAHPMEPRPFESDLSEDGVVNVCNPKEVREGRVAAAVAQWNAVSARWGTPALRQVAGDSAPCEVTVVEQGGARAAFSARVVFEEHPDMLQISDRFAELPVGQRQAVITHEFGHVLGLGHPPADATLCAQSVMTTITECAAVGAERRSTPGPHDEADLSEYWNVETGIYPVPRKCWTNEDADGDGFCDRWGPPASTFGPSSRDGSAGGGRNGGTGESSGAVRAPGVIKD